MLCMLPRLFNPKPDVIDVLLAAGMKIEAKTENDHTPLLLVASDNQNLEIVEERCVGRGMSMCGFRTM